MLTPFALNSRILSDINASRATWSHTRSDFLPASTMISSMRCPLEATSPRESCASSSWSCSAIFLRMSRASFSTETSPRAPMRSASICALSRRACSRRASACSAFPSAANSSESRGMQAAPGASVKKSVAGLRRRSIVAAAIPATQTIWLAGNNMQDSR